jgi:hypothetical protein
MYTLRLLVSHQQAMCKKINVLDPLQLWSCYTLPVDGALKAETSNWSWVLCY